jgi:hypothetical protein
VYLSVTLEVLVRGFSLGFGIRMLKYILMDKDDGNSNEDLSYMQNRFWISAGSGLAMAAFLHGTKLFIPANIRMGWFD